MRGVGGTGPSLTLLCFQLEAAACEEAPLLFREGLTQFCGEGGWGAFILHGKPLHTEILMRIPNSDLVKNPSPACQEGTKIRTGHCSCHQLSTPSVLSAALSSRRTPSGVHEPSLHRHWLGLCSGPGPAGFREPGVPRTQAQERTVQGKGWAGG